VYLGLSSVIEDVVICGNYFSHNRDLALLEADLKHVRADLKEIEKVIRAHHANTIYRVTADELLQVIGEALEHGPRPTKSRIRPAEPGR
jgi:hypothetical protein